MITLTKEEAHKLLTALEELNRLSTGKNAICLPAEIDDAIEILEAQLAQTVCNRCGKVNPAEIHTCTPIDPLLEALRVPENKREWVGLTDEEIKKLSDDCAGVRDEIEFIRAIEQALKEKNT